MTTYPTKNSIPANVSGISVDLNDPQYNGSITLTYDSFPQILYVTPSTTQTNFIYLPDPFIPSRPFVDILIVNSATGSNPYPINIINGIIGSPPCVINNNSSAYFYKAYTPSSPSTPLWQYIQPNSAEDVDGKSLIDAYAGNGLEVISNKFSVVMQTFAPSMSTFQITKDHGAFVLLYAPPINGETNTNAIWTLPEIATLYPNVVDTQGFYLYIGHFYPSNGSINATLTLHTSGSDKIDGERSSLNISYGQTGMLIAYYDTNYQTGTWITANACYEEIINYITPAYPSYPSVSITGTIYTLSPTDASKNLILPNLTLPNTTYNLYLPSTSSFTPGSVFYIFGNNTVTLSVSGSPAPSINGIQDAQFNFNPQFGLMLLCTNDNNWYTMCQPQSRSNISNTIIFIPGYLVYNVGTDTAGSIKNFTRQNSSIEGYVNLDNNINILWLGFSFTLYNSMDTNLPVNAFKSSINGGPTGTSTNPITYNVPPNTYISFFYSGNNSWWAIKNAMF